MSTVRDYAHTCRKELDPAAFAKVSAEFFKNEDFWDMNLTNDGEFFIDALTQGNPIAGQLKSARREKDFKAIEHACFAAISGLQAVRKTNRMYVPDKTMQNQIQAALGQYVRILLGLDFVAYLTLYFKIEFPGHTEYTTMTCDFCKPITEQVVLELKNNMKSTVETLANETDSCIQIITQEEYERENCKYQTAHAREAESQLDNHILQVFTECNYERHGVFPPNLNDAQKQRVIRAFRCRLTFDHPEEVSYKMLYKINDRAIKDIFTDNFTKLGQKGE